MKTKLKTYNIFYQFNGSLRIITGRAVNKLELVKRLPKTITKGSFAIFLKNKALLLTLKTGGAK